MKIAILCLVVAVGSSRVAHANAGGAVGPMPSPVPNFGPPVKVTFDPKTIKQTSSVDSIQKDFKGSTKEDKKLANGDHQVSLNYTTSGYPSGSGGGYEQDFTSLVLVVGPDGKIKSYAMTEAVYASGVWGRASDIGSGCFSDCDSGTTAKKLADEALAAQTTKNPPNTIPVVREKPKLTDPNPQQQVKSYVSGSVP